MITHFADVSTQRSYRKWPNKRPHFQINVSFSLIGTPAYNIKEGSA